MYASPFLQRLTALRPRVSLRAYLIAAVLLAALPLVTLTALQALRDIDARQMRARIDAERGAAATAAIVEREITASFEALAILARTTVAPERDASALDRAARTTRASRARWDGVFLVDAQGGLVVDALAAPHAPASGKRAAADESRRPPAEPALASLRDASRPTVTGLVRRAADGTPATALAVPVTDASGARHVIGAWVTADAWRTLLAEAVAPQDGGLVLVDRDRRVIAHTGPADGPGVAHPPLGAVFEPDAAVPAHRVWQALPGAGWSVIAVVPAAAAAGDAPAALFAAVALCLGVGIALAWLAAGRIASPLARLAAGDTDGTGGLLREVTALREALAVARERAAVVDAQGRARADAFETLFRSCPAALVVTHDVQCRDVLRNAAADALFGSDAPLHAPLLHDGVPLEADAHPLRRAAATGAPVPPTPLELGVAGQPGGRRLLAQAVALRRPDGAACGAIAAFADVTDITDAADAALRRAEAAIRAKDEFLGVLGHELRNPLSAISTAMEVLNRLPPQSDGAASAREIAARQTRQLARTLDELMEVGRILAGKVQLSRRPTEMGELVRRTVERMQGTGATRGRALHVAFVPAWVDADPSRLERVVESVVIDTVRRAPAGSDVAVSVGTVDDDAVLRVEHTAPGRAADAPRLEPFARAAAVGGGLTFARHIVEMHGGRIAMQAGAKDSAVELRLHTVDAPPAPAPEPVRRGRTRRVVLVDDDPEALAGLGATLELDGHSVLGTRDAAAGLKAVLETRPDVTIVDVGSPGVSGMDLARRSRAAGYGGLMIALAPGGGDAQDLRQALVNGFDRQLSKPVDAAALQRLLGEA